jgi:hypothetical protein
MAKKIYYNGSDTVEGMLAILKAIDGFVYSNQYFERITRSAQDFIKKGFPAFLTICKYMGASKTTA